MTVDKQPQCLDSLYYHSSDISVQTVRERSDSWSYKKNWSYESNILPFIFYWREINSRFPLLVMLMSTCACIITLDYLYINVFICLYWFFLNAIKSLYSYCKQWIFLTEWPAVISQQALVIRLLHDNQIKAQMFKKNVSF